MKRLIVFSVVLSMMLSINLTQTLLAKSSNNINEDIIIITTTNTNKLVNVNDEQVQDVKDKKTTKIKHKNGEIYEIITDDIGLKTKTVAKAPDNSFIPVKEIFIDFKDSNIKDITNNINKYNLKKETKKEVIDIFNGIDINNYEEFSISIYSPFLIEDTKDNNSKNVNMATTSTIGSSYTGYNNCRYVDEWINVNSTTYFYPIMDANDLTRANINKVIENSANILISKLASTNVYTNVTYTLASVFSGVCDMNLYPCGNSANKLEAKKLEKKWRKITYIYSHQIKDYKYGAITEKGFVSYYEALTNGETMQVYFKETPREIYGANYYDRGDYYAYQYLFKSDHFTQEIYSYKYDEYNSFQSINLSGFYGTF